MNDDQLLRYSRQIMLPDFDIAGQEALVAASALIVGVGGLGSPAAIYLATAGVGELVLTDHDTVDLSNLQRQIIHTEATVGMSKVASAARQLAAINSQTRIKQVDHKLEGDALREAVENADVVLDATDNFITRYALNEVCTETRTPLVSGAAIRFEGQVSVFDTRDDSSPCYRCLYAEGDDEALNCAENGVIAPLVGIVGTIQAMEAIKLISGVGEPLVGAVLYVDAKRMDFRRFKLKRDPNCPTCRVRS